MHASDLHAEKHALVDPELIESIAIDTICKFLLYRPG